MDGYKADVLFLGVAGLQKADDAMEAAFYRETIEKVDPELVSPVHWDNFFSPLTKPVVGIASFISRPPCLVSCFHMISASRRMESAPRLRHTAS